MCCLRKWCQTQGWAWDKVPLPVLPLGICKGLLSAFFKQGGVCCSVTEINLLGSLPQRRPSSVTELIWN